MRKLLILAVLLTGCSPRAEKSATANVGMTEDEFMLVIGIDMSGSFSHRMADGGDGHRFMMTLIDNYFRSRIGSQDKILILQLSANDDVLLYEGTPMDLRRKFPTPREFAAFLNKHADANGSLLQRGLNRALKYVLSDYRVKSGHSKVGMFVLSDMEDTENDAGVLEELTDRLAKLKDAGGILGMYYLSIDECEAWRRKMGEIGFANSRVESTIMDKPVLPNFD